MTARQRHERAARTEHGLEANEAYEPAVPAVGEEQRAQRAARLARSSSRRAPRRAQGGLRSRIAQPRSSEARGMAARGAPGATRRRDRPASRPVGPARLSRPAAVRTWSSAARRRGGPARFHEIDIFQSRRRSRARRPRANDGATVSSITSEKKLGRAAPSSSRRGRRPHPTLRHRRGHAVGPSICVTPARRRRRRPRRSGCSWPAPALRPGQAGARHHVG